MGMNFAAMPRLVPTPDGRDFSRFPELVAVNPLPRV